MLDPKVSVLIPCYNGRPFITQTLGAVFRQTWPRLEIIVVDDGSTDGSAEIVANLEHPNLRLIKQENRGQTAAYNVALHHATGEYLQFLDADDLIAPDKIEQQMRRLRDQSDCVATCAWARFHRGPEEGRFEHQPAWSDLSPLDWLTVDRCDGRGMMFPAMWLVPVAIARAVGPWREELSLFTDSEYFTRIALASRRVLFCEDASCYYRSGVPGCQSSRKTRTAWQSRFKVISLCESYVRATEDSERVRRCFSLSWQLLAYECYPYAPELTKAALDRARRLHPIRVPAAGGPRFSLLQKLIGWRLARKCQVAFGGK